MVRKRNEGFTLIELLIVIAILAILAGAMVPIFSVSRTDAMMARARTDLDSIKTGAHLLHSDTGEWPPVDNSGDDLIEDTNGIVDWNGPYLDDWANDPWGTPYAIYDDAVGNQRYVRSLGPDMAIAGGDDIEVTITPDRNR